MGYGQAMLKPGKGKSGQGKGGQGKGVRGGREPPAVRIAVPVLRKAFMELPFMKDAAGKVAGKSCLRFLCNGPLDPKSGTYSLLELKANRLSSTSVRQIVLAQLILFLEPIQDQSP